NSTVSEYGQITYVVSLATVTLTSNLVGEVISPLEAYGKKIVNSKDLANTINALCNYTIKLGVDSVTTDIQNLYQKGGLQFNIKGSDLI
ncbi:hypothetical protein, partial [Streptobacillus felis]|uniref:hypothetical protein n=1 Tax=Streptobacillus felis TaxID=1384509 RepID=UPI000ADF5172